MMSDRGCPSLLEPELAMSCRDTLPLPLLPPGSVFEWEGVRQLPAMCASHAIERPLVVTDRGLASSSMVAAVVAALRGSAAGVSLYADIDGNPAGGQVDQGVALFREGAHDGVVALGGGSGLDAGKAIAFAANQQESLFEFELDRHAPGDYPSCETPAPWIAVPTTAGTGSEVSPSAVISDATGAKRSVMHPSMLARSVLCDPQLTVGLPANLTAWTGIDALTHCLEAYCAPGEDPEADDWAFSGLYRIRRSLVRACRQGDDRESRTDMMAASTLGALAFRKGLGGLHALSHALAARFGGQHGLINAVLLPRVIDCNRPHVDECLARIARATDLPEASATAFVGWIEDLLAVLEVPGTLDEIGIDWSADELQSLCTSAAAEPNAATNPCPVDVGWARRVLTGARAAIP